MNWQKTNEILNRIQQGDKTIPLDELLTAMRGVKDMLDELSSRLATDIDVLQALIDNHAPQIDINNQQLAVESRLRQISNFKEIFNAIVNYP